MLLKHKVKFSFRSTVENETVFSFFNNFLKIFLYIYYPVFVHNHSATIQAFNRTSIRLYLHVTTHSHSIMMFVVRYNATKSLNKSRSLYSHRTAFNGNQLHLILSNVYGHQFTLSSVCTKSGNYKTILLTITEGSAAACVGDY